MTESKIFVFRGVIDPAKDDDPGPNSCFVKR